MQRILIAILVGISLLTACVMVPTGRHGGFAAVPILPPVVVLDVEPYYFQSGFYYHYTDNAWLYSRSRSGPWSDLPRSHYPKEVRFRDRKGQGNRGRGHDNRRR
jgi:hypothetical protein